MFLNSCPFCEQVNPAGAKFCNACGGALHLVPCPRCGAVSEVTATVCYQCHSQLPGRGTDAPDPAQAAAAVSKILPRPRIQAIVGTAVFAAIAVLGYYTYSQRSLVDALQPPAASSDASGRGGPAGAGDIRRDATAGETALPKPDDSAGPASPATAPPESPLADPAPEAASPPTAGLVPAKSREAKAAALPSAGTKAISEGRVSEREPSRPQACTEAAATLGLCTRPEATNVGEAGRQESPRQEACTEATAALGLCTPVPTQRRE